MAIKQYPTLQVWIWRLPATIALAALSFLFIHLGTYQEPFGTTLLDGENFQGRYPWTAVDGYSPVASRPVIQGWYWVPEDEAGITRWRLTTSGTARFSLNNTLVFETDTAGRYEVALELQAGSNFYRYEVIPDSANRLEAAIESRRWYGWHGLPTSHLYPNEPYSDPGIKTTPHQDQTIMGWHNLALIVLAGCLLWLAGVGLWRFRGHRLMLYLAVFVLALIPRLLLVMGRVAHDPELYALPGGVDNYIVLGRGVLSGGYQIAGTLWGGGNILWMALLQRWLGPDPIPLHFTNAIFGAIAIPFLVDAAWRLYGVRTAQVTAILASLYPPLLLYQTSIFVEGMGTSLVIWVLWGLVRAANPRRFDWAALILCGIFLGLAAHFRPTMMILIAPLPLVLLWQAWREQQSLRFAIKETVPRMIVVVFFMALIISPQTYVNYRNGYQLLLSNGGPQTLHLGNNETSPGDFSTSVSFRAFQQRDYDSRGDAILTGIRDDPMRAVELMFRKIGLMWAMNEDGHLISIHRSGIDASPFFAALTLGGLSNFWVLAWFGLIGLLLTSYRRYSAALLLPVYLVFFTVALASIESISRLRLPLVFPLMIGTGYTVTRLTQHSVTKRQMAVAGLGAAMILCILYGLESQLPRPRYFSAANLPANTQPFDVVFDDAIRLVGYQTLEHSLNDGGILMGRLYFERIADVQRDYRVSVALILPDGGVLYADKGDWRLGGTGYPRIPAADWPLGRGLRDEFFIPLPAIESDALYTLTLLIYDETGRASVTGRGEIWGGGTLVLRKFAMISEANGQLDPATPQDILIGDGLRLIGSYLPDEISAGSTLTVATQWQGQTERFEDWQRFVFLVDASGQVVAQQDGGLLGDTFPSSALMPPQRLRVDYPLTLPDDLPAGDYQVVIGAYRLNGQNAERLPTVDAEKGRLPNDEIPLGKIRVR